MDSRFFESPCEMKISWIRWPIWTMGPNLEGSKSARTLEHSCYILHIYSIGSKISTCLINNQAYNTRKMSILSIETLHGSGNYEQQNAEGEESHTGSGWLTQCSNFRTLRK